MRKKLISFTAAQFSWIKAEAKRLGTSDSEVLKRLVDKAMGKK